MAGGTDAMMHGMLLMDFRRNQIGLQLQLCYSTVFSDSGQNSRCISPGSRTKRF